MMDYRKRANVTRKMVALHRQLAELWREIDAPECAEIVEAYANQCADDAAFYDAAQKTMDEDRAKLRRMFE